MTIPHAWAYLNYNARKQWSEVFPEGKAPIKTTPTQKIEFDSLNDPESVFTVDWDALDTWQQQLLQELRQNQISDFSLCRKSFCCFGNSKVTFLTTREEYT